MSREADYQADLIKKIKTILPGALVLKNDSSYIQGIPDLTVLWNTQWAMLEVKLSRDSPERPNQSHYVSVADDMSFGAFIWPEIEEEVLHELQLAFGIGRPTRVPESEQLPLVELR